MHKTNQILSIIRPLHRTGLRYALTGSVASMVYGEPRMTHDVDIVLQIAPEQIAQFLSEFDVADFYCPPEDVLRAEIARAARAHFNVIHNESGFKADFYPVGRDALQQWAIEHRRTVPLEEERLSLAPPEYVIIKKLEYFREGGSEKHLRDIRGMLAAMTDLAASNDLLIQVRARGLGEVWERLLSSTE